MNIMFHELPVSSNFYTTTKIKYICVSFNKVFSIHDMGNTHSVGVVDQRLGALEVVGFAEVVQGALLLVQLVEHVAKGIAVLKVFT